MSKKRPSNGRLLLDLIDKVDMFRGEFNKKLDDIKTNFDNHETILHGEDKVSGMIKDVGDLKELHKHCPVFSIQKTIWMGVGAGILLNALIVIAITIYLDNKYRHSEQLSISPNSAYAAEYHPKGVTK